MAWQSWGGMGHLLKLVPPHDPTGQNVDLRVLVFRGYIPAHRVARGSPQYDSEVGKTVQPGAQRVEDLDSDGQGVHLPEDLGFAGQVQERREDLVQEG